MKPTKDEIIQAADELKEALLSTAEADREVEDAFLKKQAAQKRLLMAREKVYSIRFY